MFANKLKKTAAAFFNQSRLLQHNAYIIQHTTRTLEQELQAGYLTKTVITNHDLPPTRNNNLPADEKEAMIEAIKRCIVDVNYFQRDEKKKLGRKWSNKRQLDNMNFWRSELSQHVLLNMMRVVWTSPSGGALQGLHSLSHRTQVTAPWTRLGDEIEVRGALDGHMINGKHMLPLFASHDEVAASAEHPISWDDIISPFFDMHKAAAQGRPNSGFHKDAPFPFPQTLILLKDMSWRTHMRTGQAIYFSFAQALNCALAQGEQMGEDLKNPISIQCCVFNGVYFDFVCYQLNTLDFSSNEGVKNMAWVRADQKLYTNVSDLKVLSKQRYVFPTERVSLVDYDRKRLSETFQDRKDLTVTLEGFNPDTAGTFLDFLFRPSSSAVSSDNVDDDNDNVVEEVATA